MSAELTVLALALIVQIVQFALMAIPANRELGTDKTMSPRDADVTGGSLDALLSKRTARLKRSMNNHFEALILFTIAVVVVELSGSTSALTALCAWMYLVARIAYVPAYAFGWVPWRSVFWVIGLGATVVMVLAALLGGL